MTQRTGAGRIPATARCSTAGCGGKIIGWGLCARCYQIWRYTGDPLVALPPPWLLRFMAKVDRGGPGECWPWLGAINLETGYGLFNQNGTTRLVHQVAYEIGYGKIPEGLEPDHTCRNRPCVNWFHLEAVTHRENVLRSYSPSAIAAASDECPNGHRYTPETTLDVDGQRRCAICWAAKQERRNTTKRLARMRVRLEEVVDSDGGGRQDANAHANNEQALATA